MSLRTALKGGVDIRGIAPETVLGVLVVAQVFEDHGIPLVLTSVRDGKHAVANSLHYVGRAFDLRLPSRYTATETTDKKIRDEIAEALEHHVEHDPK